MQKQSISLSTRSALYYHTKTMPNITLTTPHHNSRMLETEIHSNVLEKGCYDSIIYKKGETSDPANFRPITLQPVWCKIFTTILKNRVYGFLSDNDFIDKKIQKGFWPKMDGV